MSYLFMYLFTIDASSVFRPLKHDSGLTNQLQYFSAEVSLIIKALRLVVTI